MCQVPRTVLADGRLESWRSSGTRAGRNSWSDLGEEEGRRQSRQYGSRALGGDFSRQRKGEGVTKVMKIQAVFGKAKRP